MLAMNTYRNRCKKYNKTRKYSFIEVRNSEMSNWPLKKINLINKLFYNKKQICLIQGYTVKLLNILKDTHVLFGRLHLYAF